jgi:hypothetical protein
MPTRTIRKRRAGDCEEHDEEAEAEEEDKGDDRGRRSGEKQQEELAKIKVK